MKRHDPEIAACRTYADLKALGKIRGYHPAWAHFAWHKPKKAQKPDPVPDAGPIRGRRFVITGTLSRTSREETAHYIRLLGGTVTKQVSRVTDYLIVGVGTEYGNKLARARKLQTRCINEKGLTDLGYEQHAQDAREGVPA